MQSPTPPTKPTPPTPPTMKTSGKSLSDGTPPPAKTQSTTAEKRAEIAPSTDKAAPPAPESTPVSIPPLGSYNSTTSDSKDTTTGTVIPAPLPASKQSPSSFGISIFFFFIFLLAILFLALHFWKKIPSRKTSSVDYSTESSQEIVDLILSQSITDPRPQTAPKKVIKKAKTESAPKSKGNFEARA